MRFSRLCQLQADAFVQETSLDGLEAVDASNSIRDSQDTPHLSRTETRQLSGVWEVQTSAPSTRERIILAFRDLLHALVLCEVGDPLREDLRELRRAHLIPSIPLPSSYNL